MEHDSIEQFYHNVDTVAGGVNFKARVDVVSVDETLAVVRVPYERIASLNKWKSVGEVLILGVLNVGDIAKTDGCKKAKELAEQLNI